MKPVNKTQKTGRGSILGQTLRAGTVAAAIAIGVSACGSGDAGEQALVEAMQTCPDRSEKYVEHYTCLGEVLISVIEESGSESGVAAMHTLITQDPLATTACHQAAHYAGRHYTSVEDIIRLLKAEDGTCDFGLTHGAVEGLHTIEDDAEFYQAAIRVCEPMQSGVIRYNCGHGLGHAIALRERGSITQLVSACGQLLADDQAGCMTAAAMAYTSEKASFADDVAIEIPSIPDEQLADLCESVSGEAASTCWQQIGGMYLGDLAGFPTWGETTCRRAVANGYGPRCANGYGQALYFQQTNAGDLSEAGIVGNFEAATLACMPGELQIDCIVGVSGAAASYWSAERASFEGYPDLCGEYSEPIRSACLEPERQWRANLAGLNKGQ